MSFANTVSDRRRAPRDFAELLAWLVRHGALVTADAERLERLAAEHPEEAAAVFAFTERERQLLWRAFSELADHKKLSPALLEEVNSELVEALPGQRIVADKVGLRWDWDVGSAEDFRQTLWPVILSAARILTSKYAAKVAVPKGGFGSAYARTSSGLDAEYRDRLQDVERSRYYSLGPLAPFKAAPISDIGSARDLSSGPSNRK